MPEITIEAIREGIDEEMAADERVFMFGEDVGQRGGVFRVTEGLSTSTARSASSTRPWPRA